METPIKTPPLDFKNVALLLAAHGSSHDSRASAPTRAHADAIRARGIFREVTCAFFKEPPFLREVLQNFSSREIFVVPDCMSEGWFARQILPRELGIAENSRLAEIERERVLKICAPVGTHARMSDVALHRAQEILKNESCENTSLLLVGHGTERDENSGATVARCVEAIRARGVFAEVACAFLDQAPFVFEWRKFVKEPRVVVVPFFIADGPHVVEDIPRALGIDDDPFSKNPHRICGREIFYTHAAGLDPLIADLIVEQVAAFAD